MAAPHVTGNAALLKAYNHDYSYLDIAQSIKSGLSSTDAALG